MTQLKKEIRFYTVTVKQFIEMKKKANEKNACLKQYIKDFELYNLHLSNHEAEYVVVVRGANPKELIEDGDFNTEDFSFYIFENIKFKNCNFNYTELSYAILDNSEIERPQGSFTNDHIVDTIDPNFSVEGLDNQDHKVAYIQKQQAIFELYMAKKATLVPSNDNLPTQSRYKKVLNSLLANIIPEGVTLFLVTVAIYIAMEFGIYLATSFFALTESAFMGTYYLFTRKKEDNDIRQNVGMPEREPENNSNNENNFHIRRVVRDDIDQNRNVQEPINKVPSNQELSKGFVMIDGNEGRKI